MEGIMIFMKKKLLRQEPVILPEPKIIFQNGTHRVIEQPRVTVTLDGLPAAFTLELIVEVNHPDTLKSPAWTFVGREAHLCQPKPYSDDHQGWAYLCQRKSYSDEHQGWLAFFSIVRSIPRAGV